MEVPRLGVALECSYTTAMALPDRSSICDLHRSLRQHRIFNPLTEARDRTCVLMDASWVLHPLSHSWSSGLVVFCLFVCFVFCLFRAVSSAYGSSQARDQIRAVATSLRHRHCNARSELHLQPSPQLMAKPDRLTH